MRTLNLKKSALVVVDVQRYFFEQGAAAFLNPSPNVLKNILRLINAFRMCGRPVFFTRHAHKKSKDMGQMGRWWDGKLPFDGDPTSELMPEIKLTAGDILLTKTKYSAFEETTLEENLRERNVDTVVIAGAMTNVCVETTARHSFIKDFQPVIAEDACAANSLEHHSASILNLSYAFALIEKTGSLTAKLKEMGDL